MNSRRMQVRCTLTSEIDCALFSRAARRVAEGLLAASLGPSAPISAVCWTWQSRDHFARRPEPRCPAQPAAALGTLRRAPQGGPGAPTPPPQRPRAMQKAPAAAVVAPAEEPAAAAKAGAAAAADGAALASHHLKDRVHGLKRVESAGLVSNDSLNEEEVEHFFAPEGACEEEERLRREREERAAAEAAANDPPAEVRPAGCPRVGCAAAVGAAGHAAAGLLACKRPPCCP